MAEYSSPDTAARDAFLAALAGVFAEHGAVSGRYGVSDLARLGDLLGHELGEPVGVRRDDAGRLVSQVGAKRAAAAADIPDFSASIQDPFGGPINPMTGEPEGACITVTPDFTTDPASWTCIVYLTS